MGIRIDVTSKPQLFIQFNKGYKACFNKTQYVRDNNTGAGAPS